MKPDPKRIKNQQMAAKVQLMKLKMKAKGAKSVPTDERIYFGVKSAKCHTMTPIFVSSKWSLGKVIDVFADTIGLENSNNVCGASKLKIFRNIDGGLVSTDLEKCVEEAIKDQLIFNGDMLIIDYVDENISHPTCDPSKYK